MHGGYNIETLVGLLTDADLGAAAAEELKHTLLMFDAFHDVDELARAGNENAPGGSACARRSDRARRRPPPT